MPPRVRSVAGAVRRVLVERFPPDDSASYARPSIGIPAATPVPAIPVPVTPATATPAAATRRRAAPVRTRSRLAIGWLLEQLERPDPALENYLAALRSSPASDRALAGAVRTALAAGDRGIVRVLDLGLTSGRLGDTALAVDIVRTFLLTTPRSEVANVMLAMALTRAGEFDSAAAQLDACSPSLDATRARAELVRLRGRSRGGLLVAEAAELIELWERILERRPDDSAVRDRLVRHLVWTGEYEHARAAACRPNGPRVPDHAAVPDGDVPPEWLYAAHADALAAGDPILSNRIKRRVAENLAASIPAPTAPCWRFLDAMRALSFLGRTDDALDEIARRVDRSQRLVDRRSIEKLAADLRLSDGDPEPIISVRTTLETPTVEAERRFADRIGGASVLVVGPAPGTQPSDEELARADVVVFTKRPRARPRPGQTIAVYIDTSTALLEPSARATGDGAVDIVVLRPSFVGLPGVDIAEDGSVRVMQCEDSNSLLGTRFGVQRIVYDLIAYRPRELVVSGIDFFLGPVTYLPGYNNEVIDIYEPSGLQPARSFAPHDFLWDYRFVRDLARAGLLTATAEVRALLDLSDDEYLDRLGAQMQAQMRAPS